MVCKGHRPRRAQSMPCLALATHATHNHTRLQQATLVRACMQTHVQGPRHPVQCTFGWVSSLAGHTARGVKGVPLTPPWCVPQLITQIGLELSSQQGGRVGHMASCMHTKPADTAQQCMAVQHGSTGQWQRMGFGGRQRPHARAAWCVRHAAPPLPPWGPMQALLMRSIAVITATRVWLLVLLVLLLCRHEAAAQGLLLWGLATHAWAQHRCSPSGSWQVSQGLALR